MSDFTYTSVSGSIASDGNAITIKTCYEEADVEEESLYTVFNYFDLYTT